MATSYSPKIITDGLVLCLDAGDRKSLLAAPSVNLANNSSEVKNWTTSGLGGSTVSQSTVDVDAYHYRFVLDKGGAAMNWRIAFDHTNMVDASTYIISYKYKITSGSGTFRANDFCDQAITRTTTALADGWYYETASGSRSGYTETYDFLDMYASDSMTVDIKEIQMELTSSSSPLATTFMPYQRKWQDRAGTNDGTPTNMLQSSFSTDNEGYLVLDGANDYIALSNPTDLQFIYSDTFSLEVWINPDDTSGFKHLIGKSYPDYRLAQTGTTISFRLDANNLTTNSGALVAGEWAHIIATWEPSTSTAKVYQDGTLRQTVVDTTVDWTTTSNNFQLGNSPGESYYFNGKISTGKAYTKALTASEVLQNYNATKSRFN